MTDAEQASHHEHETTTLHTVEWTTTQDSTRRQRIVSDPEAITTRLQRVEEEYQGTERGWREIGREPVERVVVDGEELDLPAFRQPEAGTEVDG